MAWGWKGESRREEHGGWKEKAERRKGKKVGSQIHEAVKPQIKSSKESLAVSHNMSKIRDCRKPTKLNWEHLKENDRLYENDTLTDQYAFLSTISLLKHRSKEPAYVFHFCSN